MNRRDHKKLKKRARQALDQTQYVLARARKLKRKDPELWLSAQAQVLALKSALMKDDPEQLELALLVMNDFYKIHLSRLRPSPVLETVKALVLAVLIAFFIRWLFIEPFRIPSGSMIPTLLVGDQLMVNKMSFGPDIYVPYLDPDLADPGFQAKLETIRKHGAFPVFELKLGSHKLLFASRKLWGRRLPRRGEVVVFRYPHDSSEDYIKRVIGLPGDVVSLQNGVVYLNGQKQPNYKVASYDGPHRDTGCERLEVFEETLTDDFGELVHPIILCQDRLYGSMRNMDPELVPEGHLFVMGDNRDSSADSRVWGVVPLNNLKGKALFIHLPLDPDHNYLPRWGRFFKKIK